MKQTPEATQIELGKDGTVATALDLATTNNRLQLLSASERIDWAISAFPIGLFALTSAGIDSALMIDHLSRARRPIPVIHINTGFLPDETLSFRDGLRHRYGFQLIEIGPSEEEVADIKDRQLWDSDLESYTRITKLTPLSRAIGELGVAALLTAVRRDQTVNRGTLDYVGRGNDSELRIHPFIDWSTEAVSAYIEDHQLPRNALYEQGFGSVEDQQIMLPGNGREGRTRLECGLHMQDGALLRQAS